jgi:hypothetical protein
MHESTIVFDPLYLLKTVFHPEECEKVAKAKGEGSLFNFYVAN